MREKPISSGECERINFKKRKNERVWCSDWNEINFVIIIFTDRDTGCGGCD